LDRVAAAERRVTWLAIGLGALLTLGLALFSLEPSDVTEVEAIVRFARIQHDEESGRRYTALEFQLADGKVVKGSSIAPSLPPRPGDHVIVRERRYWTGYRSYQWEGKMK
jgi:hypothetical protein